MTYSLKRQIRNRLIVVLVAVMGVLLIVANESIEHVTRGYIATRLQHDAESLLTALVREDDEWRIDEQRLPTVYRRVRSGHYYQVRSDSQHLWSRSLWDAPPDIAMLDAGATRIELTPGPGGERWLVWSQGVRIEGAWLTLWVAEDIAPFERQRFGYFVAAAAIVLIAALVLIALQQWVLRRGFRALDDVQSAVHRLQRTGEAIDAATIPAEVRPLVDEIDRLLDRLQQRTRRSRNAIGNLAHELRRSLQRLTALERHLDSDAAAELREVTAAMSRLIQRELRRARIAGEPAPGRPFIPADDMPHLINALERIHERCHITAVVDPELRLEPDRDDMLEVLGNLLDNACKHAHRDVHVALQRTSEGMVIIVDDDGAGISEGDMQRLQLRGVRLDENGEGEGLGLSICRDIVDSYQGKITFARSPRGGLRVVVVVPEVKAANG
jgi:signal transduction histidine kinase